MYVNIILGTLAVLIAVFLTIGFLQERTEKKHYMSFMEGLNLTGLPIVTLTNNGHKLNFVLDTGSANSLINKDVLGRISFDNTDYVSNISGIDNKVRKEEVVVKMSLIYKDKITEGLFVVTDLNDVFASIRSETGVQLHGLLGSNFFVDNKYVIDYNEMVAYSKRI